MTATAFLTLLTIGLVVLMLIGALFAVIFGRACLTPPYYQDRLAWRVTSQAIWLGLLVLAIVVTTVMALATTPRFSGWEYWSRNFLTTAILAAPMALVVASGGLDLSVGAVAAIAGVLIVRFADGGNAALGFFLAGVIALAIGLAQGLLVALARIPSVLLTLITSMVLTGIAGGISEERIVSVNPSAEMWNFQPRSSLLVWIPAVAWIGALAVLGLLTPLGRRAATPPTGQTDTLGGRLMFLAPLYVLTSLAAAAVGALQVFELRSAMPFYYSSFSIDILVVVVLGGTFFGARNPAVIGALLAAFATVMVRNLLLANALSPMSATSILFLVALCALLWGQACHSLLARIYQRMAGKALSRGAGKEK